MPSVFKMMRPSKLVRKSRKLSASAPVMLWILPLESFEIVGDFDVGVGIFGKDCFFGCRETCGNVGWLGFDEVIDFGKLAGQVSRAAVCCRRAPQQSVRGNKNNVGIGGGVA